MIKFSVKNLMQHDGEGVILCSCLIREGPDLYMAFGTQSNQLMIYDANLELIQTLEFGNWVRAIKAFDIYGNGYEKLFIGSADKTIRVLDFNSATGEFEEEVEMHQKSLVSHIDVYDLDNEGNMDLVVCTYDRYIRIFDAEFYNPKWEMKLTNKVSALLVADVNGDGNPEIICATDNGELHFIDPVTQSEIKTLEFAKQINTLDIGILDVSNEPILLAGGNEHIIYYIDKNYELIKGFPVPDRITKIKIADIDGEGHPEVLVGIGNKFLAVLEIKEETIASHDLKWKIKITNSVTGIEVADLDNSGKRSIVYAGYEKIIRVVQDYNYGAKPTLNIPVYPLAPGVFCSDNDVSQDGATADSSGSTESGSSASEDYPTASESDYASTSGQIAHSSATGQITARSHGDRYPSDAIKAGEGTGITEPICGSEIDETSIAGIDSFFISTYVELSHDHNIGLDSFDIGTFVPVDIPIYVDIEDTAVSIPCKVGKSFEIPEELAQRIEILESGSEVPITEAEIQASEDEEQLIEPVQTEQLSIAGEEVIEVVKEILKNNPYPSRQSLLSDIKKQTNIKQSLADHIFEDLKRENLLLYSRNQPRGYYWNKDKSIPQFILEKTYTQLDDVDIPQSKVEVKKEPLESPTEQMTTIQIDEEAILTRVAEKKVILSKTGLFELFEEVGIDKDVHEAVLGYLFENNLIKYSRTAPRGYSVVTEDDKAAEKDKEGLKPVQAKPNVMITGLSSTKKAKVQKPENKKSNPAEAKKSSKSK